MNTKHWWPPFSPFSDYEAADKWNAAYPPGTRVLVTLADGKTFESITTSVATQIHDVARVLIAGRDGVIQTTMLTPLPDRPN